MHDVFPQSVLAGWQADFSSATELYRRPGLSVSINPELDASRAVTLLQTAVGLQLVLTPELARRLALQDEQPDSEDALRVLMHAAGIRLHGADLVFHFSTVEREALLMQQTPDDIRQLDPADPEDVRRFAAFCAANDAQERDDAWVELDHWLVYGAIVDDALVCAASMYPWQGQRLADIGVLTSPVWRGKGWAQRVVRAISRHALERGYEPQYRCQHDHHLSQALAKAAGLSHFANWQVLAAEESTV